MDEIGQVLTVVEMLRVTDIHVGIHALVHIIEGTVLHKGDTEMAGDVEQCSVRGGKGQHHAGAAAGGLADQSHLVAVFQHGGDQIAAGETEG